MGIMTQIPDDAEEKIGKPQILARTLTVDGRQILVRLQRPFEEPDYDDKPKGVAVVIRYDNGTPSVAPAPKDEKHIKYGTCLIVETWCDATKTVVTTGIKRPRDQTEEAFAFGVRYMLNNASDQEIIEVLKIKRLDVQLKFQSGPDDAKLNLPKPPKTKKKPT
jgi:hypothetical protein